MMGQEEFEIEVDRFGKVTIRTIGIKGPRCVDAAEVLAKIIGNQDSKVLTQEYYEEELNNQSHIDVRQQY